MSWTVYFFDIVGIRPCWCAACRAEMKERGVDASDEMAVRACRQSGHRTVLKASNDTVGPQLQ